MAREARLWEFLRDGLRGTPGLHMRRVENLVSAGDPDVDGCYLGRYFEIELKGCDRPARAATPIDVGIRKSQVIWHRKRGRAGGNTWLYIRVGKGADLRKYLIPGEHASSIEGGDFTEAMLEALAVLPPQHTAGEALRRVCFQSSTV